MKRYLGIIPASALAVVLAFSAQTALAGIDGSKHDLGSVEGVGTTSQICVFCHTPHGSNTAVDAPLWNKATKAPSSYTPYSSATLDNDAITIGGVSLACLSCHDGTQARDNFINGPGSGNYNASGASDGGSDGNTLAAMLPGSVAVLGTNLLNDHPVSMNYAALNSVTSAVGSTANFRDKDFNTLKGDAQGRLWVDTPAASGIGGGTVGGSFEKTDLPLYGPDKIEVECGTCHDPHSTTAGVFLRTSNNGSAICMSCHTK